MVSRHLARAIPITGSEVALREAEQRVGITGVSRLDLAIGFRGERGFIRLQQNIAQPQSRWKIGDG